MNQISQMTKEDYNNYKKDDRFIHNLNFAVTCLDKDMKFKYKKAMTKYTIANKEFIVNEEQIKQGEEEYNKRKKNILNNIKNKLVFVGMGMDFIPLNKDYIGNHRIRTYFFNNDKVLCFVEFGTSRGKDFLRCDHALFNTKNNDKWRNLKEQEDTEIRLSLKQIKGDTKYTKKNVLKLVNKYFNCSFTELEVYSYFISPQDYNCKSLRSLK